MKATLWCFGISLSLLVLDNLAGRYLDWRKKRDAHIRAKDLARFNLIAFRGAKKSAWHL